MERERERERQRRAEKFFLDWVLEERWFGILKGAQRRRKGKGIGKTGFGNVTYNEVGVGSERMRDWIERLEALMPFCEIRGKAT